MRSSFKGVVVAVCMVAASGVAQAQSAEAEARNEEGKELFKDKAYADAAAKFREAWRLAPDPRYAFNLCAALEKVGDLDGAIEACDAVFSSGAPDDLKSKAGTRSAAIRKRQRDEAPIGGPAAPPRPVGAPPGGVPGSLPPPPPGVGNGLQPGVAGGPADPGMAAERRWTPPADNDFQLGNYRWAFGAESGVVALSTQTDFGSDTASFYDIRAFVNRALMPSGTLAVRSFIDMLTATDTGTSGGFAVGTGLYLNLGGPIKFSAFVTIELGEINDTSAFGYAGGVALGLRLGERLYLTGTLGGQSVSTGNASGGGPMALVGFEYRMTTRPGNGNLLE